MADQKNQKRSVQLARNHLSSLFYPRLSFYPNASHLLMKSYAEIGGIAHFYFESGGDSVRTCSSSIEPTTPLDHYTSLFHGIAALDFDSEGHYIVSATFFGCITVHDFYKLYSTAKDFRPVDGAIECIDSSHPELHMSLGLESANAIKWNPSNRHQIAYCTSHKVSLYDVEGVHPSIDRFIDLGGTYAHPLTDIAFASDGSRIAASGKNVGLWDPRQGGQPILLLKSKSEDYIKSIQFDTQDQIFAAGRKGIVYIWDIRAATAGAVNLPSQPLATWELPQNLKLESTSQGATFNKGICSIRFNPCCSSQLAFLTENGWTGVFDTHAFRMTHSHLLLHDRPRYYGNPSWLQSCSVYAVPVSKGIRLLDFYDSPKSPSHVDYRVNAVKQNDKYRDVSSSQMIVACAAHPSYNAIVAGTKRSSLVIISQRKSNPGEEEEK